MKGGGAVTRVFLAPTVPVFIGNFIYEEEAIYMLAGNVTLIPELIHCIESF